MPLLYRLDPRDSTDQLLTPGEEPVFALQGSASLHASKPLVIFGKDEGGDSNYAVYLLDYSSGELRRVSGPMGRLFYVFWETDDTWLVVGHDQETVYARRLDGEGNTEDLYTTKEQILGAAYDNKRRLLAMTVGRGEGGRIAVMDVSRPEDLRWVPDQGVPPFYPPSVYPEKGYLAYTRDLEGEKQEIVVRSIDSLEEVFRVPVPGFGSGEWVDGENLFSVLLKDGRLSPHTVNVRTGEWSPPLTDASALFSTITKDGPVWVSNSFFQPPFLQALRGGKVVALTPPTRVLEGAKAESHYYQSFDGRKVQGWLLRSPDPRAQLVVYCHGGPTAVQGDWWWPEIPALVLAGYHVFAPNFRGSDGFGSKFRDLNIGDLGGGDLKDVVYGMRYASGLLGLEGAKTLIVGGSYGGYLTLEALTTQPDQWRGGVAIAAPTDWTEYYGIVDSHYRGFCVHFFGGTPLEKPELYRDRSPMTHLPGLRSPLLLLHGENDRMTPLGPVRRFYDEARKRGLPVELVVTKDEGHGSLRDMNAIRDTVLTLEHLRKLTGINGSTRNC